LVDNEDEQPEINHPKKPSTVQTDNRVNRVHERTGLGLDCTTGGLISLAVTVRHRPKPTVCPPLAQITYIPQESFDKKIKENIYPLFPLP